MKTDDWSVFMVTAPRNRITQRQILRIFKALNCEKWIIGKETGKNGYKHWQIRYRLSEPSTTDSQRNTWSAYGGHVIRAETSDWEYEAKTGHYLCSWESGIAFIGHGHLRGAQIDALRMFKLSGRPEKGEAESRKIVVWYNKSGRAGKTYFVKWMIANHKAVYIPPQMKTALSMIQWAYGYPSDSYIIDMPRNVKNTEELWGAIETIKDGYAYDPRYGNKFRMQRSPKIIVLTNKLPPKTLLSDDRWVILTD